MVTAYLVLILVLMEDALVHRKANRFKARRFKSLNPCFNGRCTRTYSSDYCLLPRPRVLILVLMEDALVRR